MLEVVGQGSLVVSVQVLDYSIFRGDIFGGLICHCRDIYKTW